MLLLLATDYCFQPPARVDGFGAEQAVEGDSDDLFRRLLFGERAAVAIPAREPVDHAEEAEGRGGRVHVLQPARRLQLFERVAQVVEVGALAVRDLSVLRG